MAIFEAPFWYRSEDVYLLSESQDNNTWERNQRAAEATPMSDGAEAFAKKITAHVNRDLLYVNLSLHVLIVNMGTCKT